MKKWLITALALTFLIPSLDARRPKPRAGDVDDNVYTDKTYNFKLTVPEDWKSTVKLEEENFRLMLVKKNYGTPAYYASAPENTYVPRLSVYVGEAPMGPFEYIDSLLSHSYDTDQKDELMREFEIMNEQLVGSGTERLDISPRSRRAIEINGMLGSLWTAQVNYFRTITLSASAQAARRVPGTWGGAVLAIKNGDKMLLMHMMCEWNFFEANLESFMQVIQSLEWEKKK